MALRTCTACGSDEDLHLDATLADGRQELRCGTCGHRWVHGEAAPARTSPLSTYDSARSRFPTRAMVTSGRWAHVEALKTEFLGNQPLQDPDVGPYWTRYQRVFSAEGLLPCDPQDLKDFANNAIGANPGNMSVFNSAWNQMGESAAADQTRAAIEYLLRGPEQLPVEDRLTHLIEGHHGRGMKGFKEALLTRVLCVVHPEKFLPILIYSGDGTGKREISEAVFGLRMPKPDQSSMHIGRLAVWSNDLLLDLVGEGFETRQHASAFLWWAKDRPAAEVAR